MSDDSSRATIETVGSVGAKTENVDITARTRRKQDESLTVDVYDHNDSIGIEAVHDDGDTRVDVYADLDESETEALADALDVEREVEVERGRPTKQYDWQIALPAVVIGTWAGLEAATPIDAIIGLVVIFVSLSVVSLVANMSRGDVLGGGF